MKYIKVYETFKFHTNELYDETALDFVNKYYSDETGESYYGDYNEILNRVNDFVTTDFPQGLNNIPDRVVLYRLLNVNDITNINKSELGKSYVGDKEMFDDIDFLESFLFRYGEKIKKWFIVTIETDRSNIDLEGSMGNRAEYPDEFEIVLKNDINLKIIDIQEIDNSVYL